MIKIAFLQSSDLPAAARLFVESFKQLRQTVPVVPPLLEDPQQVAGRLEYMVSKSRALAAWEQDSLVGLITWYEVSGFRDTGRKAAYVPEWGHAARGLVGRVYQALYRAAGEQWQAAGCQVHAITLLAHDQAAREAWFWNGFGLGVVDAVRPMQPVGSASSGGLVVRQAARADAQIISELDSEHCRHYTTAPTFMTPRHVDTAEEVAAFLSTLPNSIWLALEDDRPAGFLKFSSASEGAAGIVESDQTIANVGAYVRPEYRGRRAAPAMLDAAIEHYRQQGFTCCAVDFESFNPEATDFWLRYFTPVCLSLFRVPENVY